MLTKSYVAGAAQPYWRSLRGNLSARPLRVGRIDVKHFNRMYFVSYLKIIFLSLRDVKLLTYLVSSVSNYSILHKT